MTATKQSSVRAREIIEGLGLDSAGTKKTVEQRLAGLDCEDFRAIVIAYECPIGELAEKLYRTYVLKDLKKNLCNAKPPAAAEKVDGPPSAL